MTNNTFNGLNSLHRQNMGDQDEAEDSDVEEAKLEINQVLATSPIPKSKQAAAKQLSNDSPMPFDDEDMLDSPHSEMPEEEKRKAILANSMSSKFRMDLILVMIMQTLSFMLRKLGMAKDLDEDLQAALGVSLYAD